jgi:transcriptional regulator with XRE-family HTH domain
MLAVEKEDVFKKWPYKPPILDSLMTTFAERLKIAIVKREVSQAEAARMCGIAQQSLNYIITNNLKSSKLAPKIANALGINPEWLILGHGKFEDTRIYELPIIHSPYMLKKYLKNELDENSLDYTVINTNLGDSAFAYILEAKKMVICSVNDMTNQNSKQYLHITDAGASINHNKGELAFPIFEWRIRDADF